MKLRLIFIITLLQTAFAFLALAQSNLEDTDPVLKQLNKQFGEPKENRYPPQPKPKIDIESLGLDKIDDKNSISNEEKNISKTDKKDVVQSNIENISPTSKDIKKPQKLEIDNLKVKIKESKPKKVLENNNENLPLENNLENKKQSNEKKEEITKEENNIINNKPNIINDKPAENPIVGGTISKIQSFVKDSEKPSVNKTKSKYNTTKNEKKQKEKLSELNKLRKKYLIKNDSKKFTSEDKSNDEVFSDDNIKIIPRKREIKDFKIYEVPAPPIFDKFRTKENVHIPSFMTKEEKISMLFEIITNSNNTSYFKSSYDQIGDPNIRNLSGDTILTYALLLQKHSMIGSILGLGANPNTPNSLGYTPLAIAIEIGDTSSLKMLMDNNVDVDYVDAFGRNYLMHASRVGFLPAVEMLVEKGIDVNAIDNEGFTALSIAYRHKKDIIAKFLLKHGAKAWLEKPYDSSSQSLIKELNDRWKN